MSPVFSFTVRTFRIRIARDADRFDEFIPKNRVARRRRKRQPRRAALARDDIIIFSACIFSHTRIFLVGRKTYTARSVFHRVEFGPSSGTTIIVAPVSPKPFRLDVRAITLPVIPVVPENEKSKSLVLAFLGAHFTPAKPGAPLNGRPTNRVACDLRGPDTHGGRNQKPHTSDRTWQKTAHLFLSFCDRKTHTLPEKNDQIRTTL